ncbi:MAG TPA: efflux RND transporter permease subunit [Anaeromyxobacteraceae bacterium]|nr:efflux RND transporter permease subunit [Anaeromyxobacteraceae bacterium]
MWLTRLALRNPVFILMMSLAVLALGWVSLTRLSVDLFPNIDIPIIRVATFYAGAGPADVEKTITVPIERAVSAAPGVDRVESTSKQGFSNVAVWFQFGTNLDNAQFEVQQRVAQILNTLPPGIDQPFIIKFDVTNIPVLLVSMSAEGMDEKQLYDLGYNVVEPQLERIKGVASAPIGGGRIREIEVKVRGDALRARGLGILDVVNAVRSSNLLLPSGTLRAGVRDYNVFSNTQFGEARPLREVIIRPPSRSPAGDVSAPVRISDVANVVDGTADQTEIARVNGQRAVYFRIQKQPGANTVAVVDAVKRELPRLRGIPPSVKLATSFDQSAYIRAAISSLEHEAVQGGALAILVILLFLVSLAATGIIAVAIPLSIVATFVLMFFSGMTLNVFTLGGLALGVGRLVDDSIVELENIHRHLAMGQNRREAVLNAAQEVAMPIFVSTVTTIVVFFPVVFLFGVARNLFMPLAATIAFALIMSFLVSRTVTPLLCLRVLRVEGHEGGSRGLGGQVARSLDRLDHAYARALRWVLGNRGKVILGIALFFAASLAVFWPLKLIGREFFPETDESQFQITLKGPVGTRVEMTEKIAERIERAMLTSLGPVKAAGGGPIGTTQISNVGLPLGRTALFSSNTGPHAGTVSLYLVPHTQRPITDNQAADRVRQALRDAIPGVQTYFFVGGIVKRILNFGSPAPIDVEIVGYDLDAASDYAKRLLTRLRAADAGGKPVLTDVQVSREENYPELDVVVDREKAGLLGLTEQQVAQSVLTSLVGNTQFAPVPFTDSKTGNQYFINVRLEDAYRDHVEDLKDVFVRTPSGQVVNLANIAAVKRSSGPVLIDRKYLQRIVHVTANVAPGQDLGSASETAQRAIDELPPPEGFTAQLGGQTAAQKEAYAGLLLAGLMAIGLVYMILASQFRSLLDPLVIMFSVPMGISGVFLALWLTGTPLSVNSFMGIIMMVGIVVSNGVLLVDFARVLRSRGLELFEATVQAGKTRLRPILMTTIATIFGLLPMALGFGEGSETNLPLARAVIGGLAVSTFFTLFLIPALYTLLERFARPHREEGEEPAAAAGATAP